MAYAKISDICRDNDEIRARLKSIVAQLTDEQASLLPAGEKWTIADVVEHLSVVEEAMMKISGRLLEKDRVNGQKSDGRVSFSENFLQKTTELRGQRLEAPDFTRPTGRKTIAESLAKMDENRRRFAELRPLFETVACGAARFPHPALGDLNAHDWLALIGGHERRHIEQIERLLEKIK